MPTLLSHSYPYLRILRADGTYAAFSGGKLELPADDPDYDRIMSVAASTPSIVVLATVIEPGGTKRNRRVKEAQQFACDADHPVMVFEDAETLALHNQTFHLAKPELDEEGKLVGAE